MITGSVPITPRNNQKLHLWDARFSSNWSHTRWSGSTVSMLPEFCSCCAITHDVVPNRPPVCFDQTTAFVNGDIHRSRRDKTALPPALYRWNGCT